MWGVSWARSWVPSTTTPGKPTDTRSNGPSDATSFSRLRRTALGVAGRGVGTRARSVKGAPRASRTIALRPVPPISIQSVRGSRTANAEHDCARALVNGRAEGSHVRHPLNREASLGGRSRDDLHVSFGREHQAALLARRRGRTRLFAGGALRHAIRKKHGAYQKRGRKRPGRPSNAALASYRCGVGSVTTATLAESNSPDGQASPDSPSVSRLAGNTFLRPRAFTRRNAGCRAQCDGS